MKSKSASTKYAHYTFKTQSMITAEILVTKPMAKTLLTLRVSRVKNRIFDNWIAKYGGAVRWLTYVEIRKDAKTYAYLGDERRDGWVLYR